MNFELIVNSEFLVLRKILNIYIHYLIFSTSRQHVNWKQVQVQVYTQQWFQDEQGVKFM